MKKICIKCLVILDTYNKNPNRKWNTCNVCYSFYLKENAKTKKYTKDKEKVKKYNQEYYNLNKEKEITRSKMYQSSAVYKNKDKSKEKEKRKLRQKERLLIDPLFRLKRTINRRLNKCLKSKKWNKKNKTILYIGCSLEELKLHLEKQFKPGMTWENHGEWHIDHIIPLASAKTEEDLYKLNHYTNLQPLWAIDNLKKSNKIN